ncbi:transglycosylase SLT domain-containing protein [Mesorhizobium sp. NBSH29]|uniref:lytic transglycosylase domain-containing protein n=1 Tax=Mesorhizobium sp. NBSH29 TaxID=2654249 RepID=UPI0018966595|nr:lytic transglycosylase domain-containing protein [Mesorhizobium sp. NBSH29]QPC88376.1 transglycosylase SLT domain-containing protein [Mesorhizobium sp. NBSH29]
MFLAGSASFALAGCTTPSPDAGASVALAETADLTLPDSVSILPSPSIAAVAIAEGVAEAPAEVAKARDPEIVAVAELAMQKSAAAESDVPEVQPSAFATSDAPRGDVHALIAKYAALYDVPVDLVRSVAKRESNFRPAAYNNGHWGLMQIKHATARGMGYKGSAKGLLDAETNLKYSVKYLRGAWLVADGNPRLADRLYQSGYYYHAKRKGLLEETGLGKDRRRRRTTPGA